jgi:predicted ATP-grasp superfamily ATP-dependent carboligase
MCHHIQQYKFDAKTNKYDRKDGSYKVDCIACDCNYRPYSHCHMCKQDDFNLLRFVLTTTYSYKTKIGNLTIHKKRMVKFHYTPQGLLRKSPQYVLQKE